MSHDQTMAMETRGPLSEGAISYLFITVHDFAVMHAFYRSLGFETPYFQKGEFAFMRLKNDRGPSIAMYAGRSAPVTDDSHWFLVIDVKDIESTVARLTELGIEVGDIQDVPYGRAATFKDPEGNIIEVHEPAA